MRRKKRLSVQEVYSALNKLKISKNIEYYKDSAEWAALLSFLGKKNIRKNRKTVWALINKKISFNDSENIDGSANDNISGNKEQQKDNDSERRRRRRPKRLSSSEFVIPDYFRSTKGPESKIDNTEDSPDSDSSSVQVNKTDVSESSSSDQSKDTKDEEEKSSKSDDSSQDVPKTKETKKMYNHDIGTGTQDMHTDVSDIDDMFYEESGNTTDEQDKTNSPLNAKNIAERSDIEQEKHSNENTDLSSDESGTYRTTKGFHYPDYFTFELSSDEYNRISPQDKAETVKWRRLRGEWTDLFQEKFSHIVPCCVLVFVYNRVKKTGSRKLTSPFFLGKAECKYKQCATYQFIIQEAPKSDEQSIQVEVSRQGEIIHEKGLKLKRHLKGSRRRQYARRLEKIGVGNLHHKVLGEMPEEAVVAGNMTECSTPTVLYKVLQETRQQCQISNYREELLVTQNVIYRVDEESSCLKGYIQSVGANPFHMIMYTEQQMRLLRDEIKTGNDILYFDATGGVIKRQRDIQKDVYYYALILKNRCEKEPPIPIAEVVSSDHTTPMIQYFLLKFRHAYKQVIKKLPMVRRIEIDFSWPLLHSVLLVFNNNSLSGYLSKCWEILGGSASPSSSEPIVIVHLCAWHMLRALGRSLETVTKDKALKTFVKYCFGMLQNCTSLEEANAIHNEIYIVLNQNLLTKEVKRSVKSLRRRIANLPTKLFEEKEISTQDISECKVEKENQGTVKESSPFTQFFTVKLPVETSTETEEDQNSYYLPEAFQCIEKFMYLFPLWSGVMLKDEESSVGIERTRDTQCHVENWFHIVKDSILRKERRLSPAEFALRLYENLKGRVRRFKLTSVGIPLHMTRKQKKKETSMDQGMMKKEKWKRKRKKQSLYESPSKLPEPRQKRKRKCEDLSNTDDSITDTTKTQEVPKKLRKRPKRDVSLSSSSSSNQGCLRKSPSPAEEEHSKTKQPTESVKKKGNKNKHGNYRDRKKRSSTLRCGITNRRNQCWMNSTIQAMKATSLPFDITEGQKESAFTREFRIILMKLDDTDNHPMSVHSLKGHYKRISSSELCDIEEQQDPHMFAAYLISRLNSECGMESLKIRYLQKCLRCRKAKTSAEDSLNILPVEIPLGFSKTSVQDVVDEFLKEETLCGTNALYCSKCKTKTPHSRRGVIETFPKLLTLQIKRFTSHLEKIGTRISIDRDIFLSNLDDIVKCFSLKAIQIHLGRSISAGHYTTLSLTNEGAILFDDANVCQKQDAFLSSTYVEKGCYILYYVAVEDAELSKTHQISDNNSSDEDVVEVQKHRITLSESDLNTLKGVNWLNDQVINGYLGILSEKFADMHFMDTFFFDTIRRKGIESMTLMDKEMYRIVLFPINSPGHWTMLALFVAGNEYVYIDSERGAIDDEKEKMFLSYLALHDVKPKRNRSFEKTLPKCQSPGGCGPYVLWVAKKLCRMENFGKMDLRQFRQEIKNDMMTLIK